MDKETNNGSREILHSIRNEMSYIATYIHCSKKLIQTDELDDLYAIATKSYDKVKELLDRVANINNKIVKE